MAEDIMRPALVREKSAQAISGSRRYYNTYLCRCGSCFIARPQDIKSGRHKSCGCGASVKVTHSMSKHSLYKVHKNMLSRCSNPNDKSYKDYGGRGISVCHEWKSSRKAFFEWATSSGWESGLFIDRIDCDGDYNPANCRFVTMSQSNQNKRPRKKILSDAQIKEASAMIANGKEVSDVARKFGIGKSTMYRLVHGIRKSGNQHGQ